MKRLNFRSKLVLSHLFLFDKTIIFKEIDFKHYINTMYMFSVGFDYFERKSGHENRAY